MSLLPLNPFVNHGGKRVVRWHRLILTAMAVIWACWLGAAAASYMFAGDWWQFEFMASVLGVFYVAQIIVRGVTIRVDELPSTS